MIHYNEVTVRNGRTYRGITEHDFSLAQKIEQLPPMRFSST